MSLSGSRDITCEWRHVAKLTATFVQLCTSNLQLWLINSRVHDEMLQCLIFFKICSEKHHKILCPVLRVEGHRDQENVNIKLGFNAEIRIM